MISKEIKIETLYNSVLSNNQMDNDNFPRLKKILLHKLTCQFHIDRITSNLTQQNYFSYDNEYLILVTFIHIGSFLIKQISRIIKKLNL